MKSLSIAFAALMVLGRPFAAPAQPAPAGLPHFRDCGDCSEMVVLPPGRFTMGSPATEDGRKDDEGPQTEIDVASFAIGKTDVTVREWKSFVTDMHLSDRLGCAHTELPKAEAGTASWRHLGFAQHEDEPVVCVSWADAQNYANWLSARTGRRYRLPTEAEWEYAARAGTTTAYPWGDEASHDFANYGSDTCCTGATGGRDIWLNTSPVGAFPPNAFGLSDMIGNVWQWVQDCYRPSLTGHARPATAMDQTDCRFRVARGGTWGDTPALIRSASRNYAPPPNLVMPDYRSAGFGLRLATSELGPARPAQR